MYLRVDQQSQFHAVDKIASSFSLAPGRNPRPPFMVELVALVHAILCQRSDQRGGLLSSRETKTPLTAAREYVEVADSIDTAERTHPHTPS